MFGGIWKDSINPVLNLLASLANSLSMETNGTWKWNYSDQNSHWDDCHENTCSIEGKPAAFTRHEHKPRTRRNVRRRFITLITTPLYDVKGMRVDAEQGAGCWQQLVEMLRTINCRGERAWWGSLRNPIFIHKKRRYFLRRSRISFSNALRLLPTLSITVRRMNHSLVTSCSASRGSFSKSQESPLRKEVAHFCVSSLVLRS